MNKRKLTLFAATLILGAMCFTSCASKKKYGCHNSMIIERLINLF